VTEASANGHGTFDLQAAAAAEAEALPFAFQYKGKGYELPAMSGWPMTTIRAVALGDLEAALGSLIGAETYDKLCADGLTLGELKALFAAAGATGGMASLPNSSRRARPASRPTSKR
jgi:hypothetical protein